MLGMLCFGRLSLLSRPRSEHDMCSFLACRAVNRKIGDREIFPQKSTKRVSTARFGHRICLVHGRYWMNQSKPFKISSLLDTVNPTVSLTWLNLEHSLQNMPISKSGGPPDLVPPLPRRGNVFVPISQLLVRLGDIRSLPGAAPRTMAPSSQIEGREGRNKQSATVILSNQLQAGDA